MLTSILLQPVPPFVHQSAIPYNSSLMMIIINSIKLVSPKTTKPHPPKSEWGFRVHNPLDSPFLLLFELFRP